jgi:hypothetical protein
VSLLLLVGCGTQPPPAQVAGTVRLEGRPLDNCLITFLPEPSQGAPTPHAVGVTDARGRYHLRLADQRAGVHLGWHRVTFQDLSVSTGIARRDNGMLDQQAADSTSVPVRAARLPPGLADPQATPFRKQIHAGRQTIDFDLLP